MRPALFDKVAVWYSREVRFRGHDRLLHGLLQKIDITVVAPTAFGALMRLHPRDYLQYVVLRDGIYEPLTISLIQRILQDGQTFVDIGANVGLHTLAARSIVGRNGRVVSIEPNPYALIHLLENLALNEFDDVEVIAAAASDATGLTKMTRSNATSLGTTAEVREISKGGLLTPCFDLASLLGQLNVGSVALLKVDVEGREAAILNPLCGGGQLPNNIIFEFFPDASPEQSLSNSIFNGLAGCGYDLLTVEGERYNRGAPVPENNIWAKRDA